MAGKPRLFRDHRRNLRNTQSAEGTRPQGNLFGIIPHPAVLAAVLGTLRALRRKRVVSFCAGRKVAAVQRRLSRGQPGLAVDPIRGIKADLAILDSAYGPELRTGDEMREAFITGIRLYCERQMPLLLPVPKYGRGLELLYLLHRRHLQLPLYGDDHFTEQFRLARQDGQWVTEHFRHELEGVTVRPLNGVPENGVCFLSEPQLDTAASEALAAQFSQAGGVMITGTTDRDTGSWRLCSSGHAAFCRIPVHCTDIDRKQLEGKNCFCRVVPYHTSSWQSAQMVLSI